MSSRSVFVVPEGVEIELTDDGLSLSHTGDIVLESTMGHTLVKATAGNDMLVKLSGELGTLSAERKLQVEADIEADHLHGRYVVLGSGAEIKAKAITATHTIRIGACELTVDAILAPQIELDEEATGRVTVIESHNDRGSTKIKGGFSLDEYDEMFGNRDDFLSERGLETLGDSPPEHELEIPEGVPGAEAVDVEIPEEEDVEDPLSLSIEDLEPVEIEDDLHPRLVDALQRITSCYEDEELPPAVEQLQGLVESRDYNNLRGNITDVWNGLLGYHQKRGIRPHHQVTHAFNVIHGLVQEL